MQHTLYQQQTRNKYFTVTQPFSTSQFYILKNRHTTHFFSSDLQENAANLTTAITDFETVIGLHKKDEY